MPYLMEKILPDAVLKLTPLHGKVKMNISVSSGSAANSSISVSENTKDEVRKFEGVILKLRSVHPEKVCTA
jgi:hypothetical protein